jgi:hypothetical protein
MHATPVVTCISTVPTPTPPNAPDSVSVDRPQARVQPLQHVALALALTAAAGDAKLAPYVCHGGLVVAWRCDACVVRGVYERV